MIAFFRQHALALRSALSGMGRAPLNFGFNMIVIAVALSLPLAGLTLLDNLRPLSKQFSITPEMSLFLNVDLSRDKALALQGQIERAFTRHPVKIQFVPKEQALAGLKKDNGLSDVIDSLQNNPLPDAYVLKLEGFDNTADATKIDAIAAQLRKLPGVQTVQVDSNWIMRLAALMAILHNAILLLGTALSLVVVAVIFNTIRLQILTHVEEVRIVRLFGANDAFVRRPFYYTGILLGLGAGLIALAVIALALWPLNIAIGKFARLYASGFQLRPFDANASALLLAFCAFLGLIGAMLSVRWHLRKV